MPDQTVLTPPAENQPVADNQPVAETKTETPAVPKWRASLSEDIRSEKMFDNIKGETWDEVGPLLAKQTVSASKLVGNSMGKLPTKGDVAATKKWQDENLPKLREAGLIDSVPVSADKYTAKLIDRGETVDKDLSGVYERFHKLGVTDKQAQGLLDMFQEQKNQLSGNAEAVIAGLEKEWGAATKGQLKLAERAAKDVGGEELIDVLNDTGLGNHPALIKMFAKIGAILAEDDPTFADTVRSDVEDAKAEKKRILTDKNHPYWSRDLPGHNDAVKRMGQLNQILEVAG